MPRGRGVKRGLAKALRKDLVNNPSSCDGRTVVTVLISLPNLWNAYCLPLRGFVGYTCSVAVSKQAGVL